MYILAPSLLAADFTILGEQIKETQECGAEYLHIDVMDGVFVPSISFGMPLISSIRGASRQFFDVHLMIVDPIRYIKEFAECGADGITFHLEAVENVDAVIDKIHEHHLEAGISIKPGTPVEAVYPYLSTVEMVLVMSVEPGFGGQSFMEEMCPKLHWLREHCRPGTVLQVDGGINRKTIAAAAAAGADCFVAGSAIFGKEDYAAEVAALRALAEQAG